jgi:hypothetical protein
MPFIRASWITSYQVKYLSIQDRTLNTLTRDLHLELSQEELGNQLPLTKHILWLNWLYLYHSVSFICYSRLEHKKILLEKQMASVAIGDKATTGMKPIFGEGDSPNPVRSTVVVPVVASMVKVHSALPNSLPAVISPRIPTPASTSSNPLVPWLHFLMEEELSSQAGVSDYLNLLQKGWSMSWASRISSSKISVDEEKKPPISFKRTRPESPFLLPSSDTSSPDDMFSLNLNLPTYPLTPTFSYPLTTNFPSGDPLLPSPIMGRFSSPDFPPLDGSPPQRELSPFSLSSPWEGQQSYSVLANRSPLFPTLSVTSTPPAAAMFATQQFNQPRYSLSGTSKSLQFQ